MSRRALVSLLGVLLGMTACAKHFAAVPIGPSSQIQNVQIDSAMIDFLAEYRLILPTERVLCIYGAVRGDSAFINFVKPAQMRERRVDYARFDSCPRSADGHAVARYLGHWHQHPHRVGDDLCRFSDGDTGSFESDPYAIIELLSCGGGRLMARSKARSKGAPPLLAVTP